MKFEFLTAVLSQGIGFSEVILPVVTIVPAFPYWR